nr:fatty acid oxidation complex subunit alpha-like [Nerophis lumbriciformis]
MTQQAVTLKKREDGVGVIVIDIPGKKQNTLEERFKEEFLAVRAEIERSDLKAVVIISAKDSSFIAGADIEMIKKIKNGAQATEGAQELQRAFDEFEASKIPYVAAIHGACLGGGLELALACRARIATDDRKTKLGLPEVQLGLLPGAGGTQRLPRLVGVEAGLDLLLTGKQLDARRAKKIGLVNEVVPPAILEEAAAKLALSLAEEEPDRSIADRLTDFTDPKALRELALAKNPAGRNIVFSQAEKTLEKKAGPHYPAPYKILEVVKYGLEKGMKKGLQKEAEAFGELVMTDVSRRLIEIFFATAALKKDDGTRAGNVKARDVSKIGVLGSGIMGHGIAYVTSALADIPVVMKDRDDESIGRGMAAIHDIVHDRRKKKRITRQVADRQMTMVEGVTDYSGFDGCQVVIEAVFEDLGVKHKVLKEVEEAVGTDVIFASNTSSIPITKIAEGASRPENVIGMHYFSPVHKMPLLEVIRTKHTSDEAIATIVEIGKRQKKTVIVVNDGAGFYTSRILGPYMNEAAWLIAEGVPVELVDKASKAWGFPVGPITLLDEVGIDTAAKVSKVSLAAFGDRIESPGNLDRLVADGRTGRKGKKGFYVYGGKKGKKKEVDETVYEVLGIKPDKKKRYDLAALGERMALQMVAEAIRCFEEEVLRSPRDGDIGAIFGLGFPPFRGGPFRFADAIGPAELLRRLKLLQEAHGKRFAPPALLEERSKPTTPPAPTATRDAKTTTTSSISVKRGPAWTLDLKRFSPPNVPDDLTFHGWSADGRRFAFERYVAAVAADCEDRFHLYVVDAATDRFATGGIFELVRDRVEGDENGKCEPADLKPVMAERRTEILNRHGIVTGNLSAPIRLTKRGASWTARFGDGRTSTFVFEIKNQTDDPYGPEAEKGAGYALAIDGRKIEDGTRRRKGVMRYGMDEAMVFESPDGRHAALILERFVRGFEGGRASWMANGFTR